MMGQGISVHISFEDVIHQENGETKFSKEVTNLEGLLLCLLVGQMFQRLQDQGYDEVFGETIRGYVL